MIFRGAALTVSSPLSSIEGAEEEEGEEESDKKEQNEDDDEENGEEDEEEDERRRTMMRVCSVDRQIEIEDRHHLLPCPDQFFPIPPD